VIKLELATLTMRVKIKAQFIHGGEEIEWGPNQAQQDWAPEKKEKEKEKEKEEREMGEERERRRRGSTGPKQA
jgi:hypothetical protein